MRSRTLLNRFLRTIRKYVKNVNVTLMLATSTILLKQFILTLSEFDMNIHQGERGVKTMIEHTPFYNNQ